MNNNNQESAKQQARFRHGSKDRINDRLCVANLSSNRPNVVSLRGVRQQQTYSWLAHWNLRKFLGCVLVFCALVLFGAAISFGCAFYQFQSKLDTRLNLSSNSWSLLIPGTMSELCSMAGQHTQAIHMYEESIIPIVIQEYGSTSIQTAQIRSILGDIYQKAGDKLAYRQQYEMALGILHAYKDKISEDSSNGGQSTEQENIYKKIIELGTRLLGANSQQVLENKLSLVSLYLNNDQWPKGIVLFEEIKHVPFWRQSSNLSFPGILTQLGERYKSDHDLQQSEYLLSEAAALCRKLEATRSYVLAFTLSAVASPQVERGQYHKALQTLIQARQALPDDGLEPTKRLLIGILEAMGWCHLGENNVPQGKRCFEEVLALSKDFGSNDPDQARGLYGLGWIYHYYQGRTDKAEQTYKESLRVIGKSDKGPLRTNIASALTDLYRARGKMKEAAALESQSTLMLQPVLTDLLLSEGKSNKSLKTLTKWQTNTK